MPPIDRSDQKFPVERTDDAQGLSALRAVAATTAKKTRLPVPNGSPRFALSILMGKVRLWQA